MANTTTDSVQIVPELEGLLSQQFIELSTRIIYVGTVGTIAMFGIVFNIVNIIVFWRQGFAEVVNMSLFSLAIADLGCAFFALVQSVLYAIWVNDLVPTINFRHIQLSAAAYPHGMFARIVSLLTSFISFERCLCIILPLKVKSILTRPVAVAVLAFIYLFIIGSHALPYIAITYVPKFQSHLNLTVLSFAYRHGAQSQVLEGLFFLLNCMYQLIAFGLVILFTSVLVFKMRQKNKWRQKTATSDQQETISARDNKVIQMVIRICVTFIICFTPVVTQFSFLFAFPVYNAHGRYRRMFAFMWSVSALGEVTCSSVTIFFYYTMSSRYAAILSAMVPCLLARKTAKERTT